MNSLETPQKLTPRQWRLYNLIKFNSLANVIMSKESICEELPDDYKLERNHEEETGKELNNCPAIYQDIKAINASCQVDKIIVCNRNNFYLATEEEAKKYADKLCIRALKAWRSYHNIKLKISKNGQGKLITNHGDVMDDKTKARMFVESYIDEELKKLEAAND